MPSSVLGAGETPREKERPGRCLAPGPRVATLAAAWVGPSSTQAPGCPGLLTRPETAREDGGPQATGAEARLVEQAER